MTSAARTGRSRRRPPIAIRSEPRPGPGRTRAPRRAAHRPMPPSESAADVPIPVAQQLHERIVRRGRQDEVAQLTPGDAEAVDLEVHRAVDVPAGTVRQHLGDPRRSIAVEPVGAEEWRTRVVHARRVVRRDDEAGRRVEDPGQVVERKMLVLPTALPRRHRQHPAPRPPPRQRPDQLPADVALDVGVDDIQRRTRPRPERAPEASRSRAPAARQGSRAPAVARATLP